MDSQDPVLGFFVRWVEEFAKHCESIVVICLREGEHHLPANVRVLSLGKESGASRIKYVTRFYKYIWRERNNYDAVFVHMNQEYILLGGLLWKLFGKKITMWRNHYAGSTLTDIAAVFCTAVFCTSKHSYTAKYKKTKFMPVGVDTEHFYPMGSARIPHSILSLGRISPSKNIHLLIEALGSLQKEGMEFSAAIYGDALPQDAAYLQTLKERAAELGLTSVTFHQGIPNTETPAIYNQYEIFVNLSKSGMYDKTIFEAAACGCLLMVNNKDIQEHIPKECVFREGDGASLAEGLRTLLVLPKISSREIQDTLLTFLGQHSLQGLTQMLLAVLGDGKLSSQ